MNWNDFKLPFTDDEHEWLPMTLGVNQTTGAVYSRLAAYITARAIMDRLDAVAGPEHWSVTYRVVSAGAVSAMICSIAITPDAYNVVDVNKLTIAQVNSSAARDKFVEDTAQIEATGDIDPFKAAASNALKRAAVHLGIGRYLYSLPDCWARNIQVTRPDDPDNWIHLFSRKDNINAWCPRPSIAALMGQRVESPPSVQRPPGADRQTPQSQTASAPGQQSAETPASEKQINFIKGLLDQKETTPDDEALWRSELPTMTRFRAKTIIGALVTSKNKLRRKATPSASEFDTANATADMASMGADDDLPF